MATKSKRKTSKRSAKRKTSSNTTTYVVIGVLVVLMLILLYVMTNKKTGTTITQPGTTTTLVNNVVNAVEGVLNNVSVDSIVDNINNAVEGFENDDVETKEASELYDPKSEVLVVFCKMEGCGHCVDFNNNVWGEAVNKLNGVKTNNGKTLKLVTVSKDAVLSKDVTGFPTIKKFGDDAQKYDEFNDKRTITNFTKFCMS